jgi:hypothetical protein
MKNTRPVLILLVIVAFQFQAHALAEDVAELFNEQWKVIEAKYCTIFYHPDVDIKGLHNRIKIRFYDIERPHRRLKNRNIEEQLADKFDCIFRKVEKILDMYPRKIHLTVKIYKNQDHLDEAYLARLGCANENKRHSYYIHKDTTIYTTQKAISHRVLAHEMGHAVTDHYFLILPPEKVKEVLCQYVEMHLEE